MSIASEITRIKNNIEDAYTECENKGATLPETENSANLADTIASIPSGGGVDLDDYINRTIPADLYFSTSNTFLQRIIKRIPILTIEEGQLYLNYLLYNGRFESIAFDGIDCTNITKMNYFLGYNTNLKTIDFKNITNTSNVESATYFLFNCTALETITNMFPLNNPNYVDISHAFENCQKLKQLDLSNWKFKNYISSWDSAFKNTYKLAVLDISGLEFNYISHLSPAAMFENCGRDCLQSDGAYADGIPYIYVRSTSERDKILAGMTNWSTNNVIVKSN